MQKEELETTRADLIAQREPVAAQYEELLPTKATLDDAMAQINAGYDQYYAGKAEADAQFASAEAQLADGERQLAEGQALLDEKWQELLDGEQALADGEKELADGRAEYEKGRATALAEFAKAEEQLAQARADFDNLSSPALYVLDRNTNIGYVVFESDSDIVAGVAKIFPLFFLAVAALVCITTMTRMIDEERTQIGILKALGYSGGAIMGKYLAYSGTASFAGCLLGLLLVLGRAQNGVGLSLCLGLS